MNINNDAEILNSTRQSPVTGGVKLLFPMEEGDPITHVFRQLGGQQYAEWCNIVRGEVIARKNSKETSARSAEGTRSPASQGDTTQVQGHGGSDGPVPNHLPATEEEMEELLRNTLSSVQEEIRARAQELSTVEKRLDSLYVQASRLENALKAYVSYKKDGGLGEETA